MTSLEVKNILEYKHHKGLNYFRVQWNDGMTTWERQTDLSCKDLVCAFFREAIGIVRRSESAREEAEKKKNESVLLQRMLEMNMDKLAKDAKAKEKILDDLVNGNTTQRSNSLLKGMRKVEPLAQGPPERDVVARKSTPAHSSAPFRVPANDPSPVAPSRPPPPVEAWTSKAPVDLKSFKAPVDMKQLRPLAKSDTSFSRPPEARGTIPSTQSRSLTEQNQHGIKAPKVRPADNNTLILKLGSNQAIPIVFFFNPYMPSLVFQSEDVVSAGYTTLLPYLHSLYLAQTSDFHVLPSADVDDATDGLEETLRANSVALVCKSKRSFWIIVSRITVGSFFGMTIRSRLVLFTVAESPYLERLFKVKGVMLPETDWLANSFKFGVSLLVDKLVGQLKLPLTKKTFIFGDTHSVLVGHLSRAVHRACKAVNTLQDAEMVLIQESHLYFLHLLTGFYNSLRTPARFFILKADGLEEILPGGGMITFSDEYVKDAELLEVADLLRKVEQRPNWEVRVMRSTFDILRIRMASDNAPGEYIGSIKLVHKMFKAGLCRTYHRNLRDHLEMTHFRTHRHFVEVSFIRNENGTITISEANRLLGGG